MCVRSLELVRWRGRSLSATRTCTCTGAVRRGVENEDEVEDDVEDEVEVGAKGESGWLAAMILRARLE